MSAPAPRNPDILAQASQARIQPGELALWHIGGAGYIIRSAQVTMLIDPFLGPGNPPDWVRVSPPAFDAGRLGELGKIDAVLLTHEHDDHTDLVALDAIRQQTTAPVYGPDTSIRVARSIGLPADRCHAMAPNQRVSIGDLQLTTVVMDDPMAEGCIGWIIDTGKTTLLHCGDSLYHPGFVELGNLWVIDAMCASVGLNPPGITFYMDEADAARAARDAGTRTLILQHFDLWERTQIDPLRVAEVANWYCPTTHVLPARTGERILITKGSAS